MPKWPRESLLLAVTEPEDQQKDTATEDSPNAEAEHKLQQTNTPWDLGIKFLCDTPNFEFIRSTLNRTLYQTPERVRIYLWRAVIMQANPANEAGLVLERIEIRLRDDCKYHLKLDKFIQRAKYQTPISDKPISAPVTIELSSVWSAQPLHPAAIQMDPRARPHPTRNPRTLRHQGTRRPDATRLVHLKVRRRATRRPARRDNQATAVASPRKSQHHNSLPQVQKLLLEQAPNATRPRQPRLAQAG